MSEHIEPHCPQSRRVGSECIPAALLVPLFEEGFFERFPQVDRTKIVRFDAVVDGLAAGTEHEMLGFMICSNWERWFGWPTRTSLSGQWMEGAIFSAAWEHVPGWTVDMTTYPSHYRVEGTALRIRIFKATLPSNPVSTLELVSPVLKGDLDES